jgi:hypothetical protein
VKEQETGSDLQVFSYNFCLRISIIVALCPRNVSVVGSLLEMRHPFGAFVPVSIAMGLSDKMHWQVAREPGFRPHKASVLNST